MATSPTGITIGALTQILGTSQSTCSHHVRKLAEVGFVRLHRLHKQGTATIVTINQACCTGLPHAADAVMGLLAWQDCPAGSRGIPDGATGCGRAGRLRAGRPEWRLGGRREPVR